MRDILYLTPNILILRMHNTSAELRVIFHDSGYTVIDTPFL